MMLPHTHGHAVDLVIKGAKDVENCAMKFMGKPPIRAIEPKPGRANLHPAFCWHRIL